MSEQLADELYKLIEEDQGDSYISDGIGNLSDAAIIAIAGGSVRAHERCARKLRRWIQEMESR